MVNWKQKATAMETQKCQEKSPSQISRENQRQRNQQPLEADGEPKVFVTFATVGRSIV